MKKTLVVYPLGPIDFWPGWLTREQYLENVDQHPYGESRSDAARRLDSLVARAEVEARRVGWEGDRREGPFFAALPTAEGDSETMVAWKQDNNGQTFVGSPYPLPWLD